MYGMSRGSTCARQLLGHEDQEPVESSIDAENGQNALQSFNKESFKSSPLGNKKKRKEIDNESIDEINQGE